MTRTICKIVLLDFVHHLNNKIKLQRFGSWIMLPSSGKKSEEDRNPICWAPGWARLRPGLRLAQPGESYIGVATLGVRCQRRNIWHPSFVSALFTILSQRRNNRLRDARDYEWICSYMYCMFAS
jgi:hypothetical protein